MAEPVVLPVVRVEPDRRRRLGLPAVVTDLNAYRYARERAAVERRSSRSLLPDLDLPCDCGDSA